MKAFLRAIVLFSMLFPGISSLAQNSCQIQFIKDSVGCAPLFLLAQAIDPAGSNIKQRVWTLYRSTAADTVAKTGPGLNPNFSFIIDSSGNYCLRLVEKDQNGTIYTTVDCNIKVYAHPVLGITFSPTEGCSPLTVTAQCNSSAGSGTIDSLYVDWGCGNIGVNKCTNLSYTFSTPPCQFGCISPNVILSNSYGCFSDSIFRDAICLIPKPRSIFYATTLYAYCTTAGLRDTLVADSTDPHLTYSWYVNNVRVQDSTIRTLIYNFPHCNCCFDIGLVTRHPSGCYDSVVYHDYICVDTAPIISWTPIGVDSICLPRTVTFTNTSPGLANLTWHLTGPSPLIGSFPTLSGNTYTVNVTQLGTYSLTASGTYGASCTGSKTAVVLFTDSTPAPRFSTPDTLSCVVPYTVHYTAGPCQGCTLTWNTPGGVPSTSTGTTTVVKYNNYGTFCASLTASVTKGTLVCDSTVTNPTCVQIVKLRPQISSSGYKGCAPECFTLTNVTPLLGLPPIDSVTWTFSGKFPLPGDTANTIARCIDSLGCDTVKLRVTTKSGCSASVVLPDTLCASLPPKISMVVAPLTVCACVDTVGVTISGDSVTFVKVDWGDGPPQFYNTTTFSHTYCDTGIKTINVIAYKDSCKGDSLFQKVTLNPPVINFRDSNSCANKDSVILVNNTIGATSYSWKFSCSPLTFTTKQPSIALPVCDTCTATLTATNSITGCKNTKGIFFRAACDSTSFSPPDTQGCAGKSIYFCNTSPSSTNTFWNFNAVPTDTVFTGAPGGANGCVFHVFNPGVYVIAMENKTKSGCLDTTYRSYKACNTLANFTFDTVCFPTPICFHDTSKVFCSPTTYLWDFGDGTTDSVPNSCHIYSQTGIYHVSLTVNSGGCISTSTQKVATSNIVNINYHLDTIDCPGLPLCATNSSLGNNLTFLWTAPGASPTTSTAAAPCFYYNVPGDYQVYFQLSSNHQCSVYDTFTVHAHKPSVGGYVDINSLACPNPPQVIHFTDTSKYVDDATIWTFGDGNTATQYNVAHIYAFPGVYPITLTGSDKMGCSQTVTIDTIVVAGPFGTFTEAPLPGICSCKDTMHYVITTYDATSVILLWGGNTGLSDTSIANPGTQQNPVVITIDVPAQPYFCSADTFQPQILYGDSSHCQVSEPMKYFYVDSPDVKFTFNNFGVCSFGTICFHDSTKYHLKPFQSYTVSRIWDFGDGSPTDTSANPCHYFGQPGGYHVKLFVQSNLGCSDSSVNALVVVPKIPVAGYRASDTVACAKSPVCFYDTSQIDPLVQPWFRIWDFGDGTPVDTVYSDSVCHTYATNGFYRVRMCVYDSIGCSACDSSTLMKVIPSPKASIIGGPTVCYGVVTQLTGSGGINFSWSPAGLFSNPNSDSPTIQLFQDTTLSVVAGDLYGCNSTDTEFFKVARVFAAFETGITVCADANLCLKDSASNLNGTLLNWVYDFGDGFISNSRNTCHKYANFGSYNIAQIVTDNHGCVDTVVHNITVFPDPVAAFTLSDTVVCSNIPICVFDQSTGTPPITKWDWDFGDGNNTLSASPPCHLYTPPVSPQYQISLVVTDQNNCTDTARNSVVINRIPTADFTWAPSCEEDSMTLMNSSLEGQPNTPIGYWQWTIWLGAPSPVIDSTFSVRFPFPAGTHNVQLVVTDINGCTDTVVKAVVTDSFSKLIVYPGDTTICLGTAVDYAVGGVFNKITWKPTIWLSDPNSPVVTINPLQSIEYQISAANGVCPAASDSFIIQVIQPIPVEVFARPESIVLGLSSELVAKVPVSARIDSVVWSPDSTVDCRVCDSTVATPTQTTTYTATVYYSYNGVTCSVDASATITVINSCGGNLIYIPNTFTPNGDGVNDIFKLRGPNDPRIHIKEFRVFDRWGRLVFEAADGVLNDDRFGWNGEDQTGKKLNPEVYVYTYQIECFNGNIVTGQGNVTLLR